MEYSSFEENLLIPWHLIRHILEEPEAIARHIQRMQDRLEIESEIIATSAGFVARRDGNAGYGRTGKEAIRDLDI